MIFQHFTSQELDISLVIPYVEVNFIDKMEWPGLLALNAEQSQETISYRKKEEIAYEYVLENIPSSREFNVKAYSRDSRKTILAMALSF